MSYDPNQHRVQPPRPPQPGRPVPVAAAQQPAPAEGGRHAVAPAQAAPPPGYAPAQPAQAPYPPPPQAQPAPMLISRSGHDTATIGSPSTGRTGTMARPEAAAAPVAAPTQTPSVAAQVGLAAAAPDAPHQGTVYSSRRPTGAPGGRPVLSGRLPKLRISSHSVTLGALSQMGISSPGTGLILGADVDQRAVPVRLFRPEPTRVTLVGGAWAAQLVLFRALALGVRTVVMTGDPASWHGFGERATGMSGRVAVVHGEQTMTFAATAQQPVLVVYDLGLVGPGTAPELGPWQTQLTVLRQLDEPGVPAVQECQLVMLQRLSMVESALAASALRLSGQSAQLLQRMEDDMVALLGGGADRYVWLTQTGVEHQHIGPPRR